jgi:hypothetical protein
MSRDNRTAIDLSPDGLSGSGFTARQPLWRITYSIPHRPWYRASNWSLPATYVRERLERPRCTATRLLRKAPTTMRTHPPVVSEMSAYPFLANDGGHQVMRPLRSKPTSGSPQLLGHVSRRAWQARLRLQQVTRTGSPSDQRTSNRPSYSTSDSFLLLLPLSTTTCSKAPFQSVRAPQVPSFVYCGPSLSKTNIRLAVSAFASTNVCMLLSLLPSHSTRFTYPRSRE